ncbi:glutamate--tRNA ligase [Candidatus Laterigemmans baculatus]|uniref:glutamate--tRNA ligase n=1 Tax=Candidatus Laterigemmans baculatus TaxID=2770505 RepID=UPI0013DB9E23|nr:glutamate--tRNA ligase [Candidatus Laterigemmans baculatus]
MVRTRFAPSPTGYLHIGGVRTALFNWLLARQAGGQFILRIDDTDQQRNVEAALKPILDGFRWLGIDWDEGPEVGGPYEPYFQSQRGEAYAAAAARLLASGHAYRDYARPEELQAQREEAEKAGRTFVYDRRWMAEDDAAADRFEAEGRTAVVRLKMPREGQCVIQDRIRGEVRVDWASEQDHVVQRADGSCLYHLASVVDDHDFAITHVVRAAEHLPNTPRQVFIAEALGYTLPEYAHLPYVAEPGGTAKLSKRKLDKYLKNKDFAQLLEHGQRIAERAHLTVDADTFNPVIVDFYRETGFLPDAILNYLLLLGWSLDGSTERFTRASMIESFTLDRVNKAPASFDPQKMLAFEADWMSELEPKKKVAMVLPYLQRAGLVSQPPECELSDKLTRIVTAAGDRIKVAGDILDFDFCFVSPENLKYDEKAFEKRIAKPAEARPLLEQFAARLASIEPFVAERIEAELKQFCEEQDIKIGQIIHALRVATTGQPVGFGMFETLEVLGREQTEARIRRAVLLENSEKG